MPICNDSKARVIVEVPDNASDERRYAVNVVLTRMLGLGVDIRTVDSKVREVRIRSIEDGRCIEVADCFFPRLAQTPFDRSSLPSPRLDLWDLPETLREEAYRPSLPVLYGRPSAQGKYLEMTDNGIWLGLDLFGSAFFMLSRYEEAILERRDRHQRFQWNESLVSRPELAMRPILDEYVHLLSSLLRRLWPSLPHATKRYELKLSHDVDRMFSVVGRRWPEVVRSAIGDVVVRRNVPLAARRLAARAGAAFGSWRLEPDNTFDFLMRSSERYGVRSAFYFIANKSDPSLDGDYDLEDGRVRALMRTIHDRGHELGLHGSYHSFRRLEILKAEFERLRQTAEGLRIRQSSWGGRQHYLRWSVRDTWLAWEGAGLCYDSTLGFAEHVGFRCGTCREYPAFDLDGRRELRLIERPLVAMDVTLLSPQYMGLTHRQSLERISELVAACRFFGGNLTLLWHNTSLVSREDRALYHEVLSIAA